MKTFIAFRCRDGGYLLAPSGATSPWFENPSVEFLGEVRADSFCQVMTVAREIAKRILLRSRRAIFTSRE